ncbi:CobW family GTP-binding protein [Faecalicatena contorta]|uniref:CobW family GTP-binding protein n=1 Tax=Faecalicatena contorta TaxID=39482 RepID=UPI001F2C5172|nr:GTP-binding protein [Faecalicatena contorta]MCF2683495.1 GTP-binding protein [Faecalicatena contorta]
MEIQIVSGFLGAGKTTFLNQYLPLLEGSTVVIENEYGDIGLDGELMPKDVPVRELYSGCICCSLAIDFRKGIREIAETFRPNRIVIEPSGVGRLSDIVNACMQAKEKDGVDLTITKLITVVDLAGFEEYAEGFGAFYQDQIRNAGLLLLSHLENVSAKEKKRLIEKIRQMNPKAIIYGEDWRVMYPEALLELVEMTGDHERNRKVGMILPRYEKQVFSSISIQGTRAMSESDLMRILWELKAERYGQVLRAKGITEDMDGRRMHFDYTPSEVSIKEMDTVAGDEKDTVAVVIGCELKEQAIRTLFL